MHRIITVKSNTTTQTNQTLNQIAESLDKLNIEYQFNQVYRTTQTNNKGKILHTIEFFTGDILIDIPNKIRLLLSKLDQNQLNPVLLQVIEDDTATDLDVARTIIDLIESDILASEDN